MKSLIPPGLDENPDNWKFDEHHATHVPSGTVIWVANNMIWIHFSRPHIELGFWDRFKLRAKLRRIQKAQITQRLVPEGEGAALSLVEGK